MGQYVEARRRIHHGDYHHHASADATTASSTATTTTFTTTTISPNAQSYVIAAPSSHTTGAIDPMGYDGSVSAIDPIASTRLHRRCRPQAPWQYTNAIQTTDDNAVTNYKGTHCTASSHGTTSPCNSGATETRSCIAHSAGQCSRRAQNKLEGTG